MKWNENRDLFFELHMSREFWWTCEHLMKQLLLMPLSMLYSLECIQNFFVSFYFSSWNARKIFHFFHHRRASNFFKFNLIIKKKVFVWAQKSFSDSLTHSISSIFYRWFLFSLLYLPRRSSLLSISSNPFQK